MPEASVIRRNQTLSGFTGRKEMRRRLDKFFVKSSGLTRKPQGKLSRSSQLEEDGIPGVAVKCVDIGKNTNGEGSLLGLD